MTEKSRVDCSYKSLISFYAYCTVKCINNTKSLKLERFWTWISNVSLKRPHMFQIITILLSSHWYINFFSIGMNIIKWLPYEPYTWLYVPNHVSVYYKVIPKKMFCMKEKNSLWMKGIMVFILILTIRHLRNPHTVFSWISFILVLFFQKVYILSCFY